MGDTDTGASAFDRDRLAALVARERTVYAAAHPTSDARFAESAHLFGGVPMTWMAKWAGGFPLFLAGAWGCHLRDVDGLGYVDFALGDTGAMAGHSPGPTVAAVRRRLEEDGGITTMRPTADGEWVGAELARRFGLPQWSFTLSATDANRWALRLARLVTGRPKVLVFSYCYHGSVDETSRSRVKAGSPARVRATWRRRSTRRSLPGWPSSTTSLGCPLRWPTATWPPCSPSRR